MSSPKSTCLYYSSLVESPLCWPSTAASLQRLEVVVYCWLQSLNPAAMLALRTQGEVSKCSSTMSLGLLLQGGWAAARGYKKHVGCCTAPRSFRVLPGRAYHGFSPVTVPLRRRRACSPAARGPVSGHRPACELFESVGIPMHAPLCAWSAQGWTSVVPPQPKYLRAPRDRPAHMGFTWAWVHANPVTVAQICR